MTQKNSPAIQGKESTLAVKCQGGPGYAGRVAPAERPIGGRP